MSPSTIISVLAVAISLVALSLQLIRNYWERPVVFVGGVAGTHQGSSSSEPHWEYRIDVTNVGERAVTLIEVGLITKREPGAHINHGLSHAEVAEFPMRLEPHDSRSWTIPGGTAAHGSNEYEPWAKIVKRPNWVERRHATLPEQTIVGPLFGSIDAELNGTPAGKASRRQRRAAEIARQKVRAERAGQRLL